jgi:hypothetical protein
MREGTRRRVCGRRHLGGVEVCEREGMNKTEECNEQNEGMQGSGRKE